ncbi:MAG: hypothetical protein IJL45_04905 [Prevotella sp.]|nr:hypothetical protein [Prevotella sp.]
MYSSIFGRNNDITEEQQQYRREQLISSIEQSLSKMTLQELEALHYDMSTKNYIND